MAIYANRLNPKQRALLKRYEDTTGLEPMYQEELDNETMKFAEVWSANLDILYDMQGDVSNFDTSGTGA